MPGNEIYCFTFDYENRLTGVKQGTTVIGEFVYDTDGIRVVGTVNGVTTVYIDGIYEYQGGASTSYYAGPNGLVAFRRSGYATDNGLFYLLQDHLKSTSVLANSDGILNARNFYYPYGDNRGGAQSALTTKRFTGQYHEAGIGLYDYNARWYDPKLARFVSADTVTPDPENPQALNKYAYTLGNPLRFSDPSGHCATTVTDPSNPNEVAQFRACWKRASQISVMYDNDPWFAKRFRVSRADWIRHVAMNPSLDAEWMQPQIDAWRFDFTMRTGLPHPDRSVEWHEGSNLSLTPCKHRNCVGGALNTISVTASAVAVACASSVIGNAGCSETASVISFASSVIGTAITARKVVEHEATPADLGASLGTTIVGGVPVVGQSNKVIGFFSAIFQALWDRNRSENNRMPGQIQ